MSNSNAILVIDGTLAILEYMTQRNLAIDEFNAELQQMKAEGKTDFTIDELDARIEALRGRVDNF